MPDSCWKKMTVEKDMHYSVDFAIERYNKERQPLIQFPKQTQDFIMANLFQHFDRRKLDQDT